MLRSFALVAAALLVAGSIASAKSDLPPGNYIVYYTTSPGHEEGLFLVKVEHKGGTDIAEVLDPPAAKLESFSVDNGKVQMVFDAFDQKLSVDTTVDAKDPKKIVGSFAFRTVVTRCRLEPTEKAALAKGDDSHVKDLPAEMAKAVELTDNVQNLRRKFFQTREPEPRAALKTEVETAQKTANEQLPGLYKAVAEKHAETTSVIDAVTALLPNVEKSATKPDDVAKWLKAVDVQAEHFGLRYRLETAAHCVSALNNLKGFEKQALEMADTAARAIAASTTTDQQARVLKAVKYAQIKAGKDDLVKQTEARLAKVEEILDGEYLAKVPPFKPTKFQGRKEGSDKVAVLELFTGAQCPPCVAADAAFDGLMKAYKPSELVLIQYHMHIPGPDPLTNPDTIARQEYYTDKFRQYMGGVPSALIDGKPHVLWTGNPRDGGGGPLANSENKFKQYKNIIDPILEEKTPIKLEGKAVRKGDKIAIKIDVAGIKQPGENIKLRLLLVEESIRYMGGNGVRFHHQVVRDMPGGFDGVALKDAKGGTTAEVDLAELRKKLIKYLDAFVAEEGPFSNPDRPLDLKHLRVIALVQDDSSREIMQALQLEEAD